MFLKADVYEQMHSALLIRVGRLENNQSKIIGVAIALNALSAVLGIILGHFWK